MSNTYSPIPLFDTLEHLGLSIETRVADVQSRLPDCMHAREHDIATDYQHTCQFLRAYRGSVETFKSYRREIERSLQWTWFIHNKTLKELRRSDLELFLEFCQAPPVNWIVVMHVERFIDQNGLRAPNPVWRPFVVAVSKKAHRDGKTPDVKLFSLSQSALQAIFAILSSYFNYLEQEEYTFGNPIAQIRQKSKFLRKHHGKKAIRRLSELQWSYIIETAEQMANENSALHERTLFIMNA